MPRPDKPAMAVLWFDKAADNLRTAKHNLDGGFFANACFMAHQATEIGFKAYLFAHGEDLYRTHGLPELLEKCIQHDRNFRQLGAEADFLDSFYIEARYLERDDDDDNDNAFDIYVAKDTIKAAQRVFEFVTKRIKPLLKPPKNKK